MKGLSITIAIIVFLLIFPIGILAQTAQTGLNQVELAKQFVGKWECKISGDSTLFWNAVPYGTGLEVDIKGVSDGKIFIEAKQLWGYDNKLDKFIIAVMHKGQGINFYSAWFLSDKKYVSTVYKDISNPETASWRIEGEFKSPEMYLETTLVNNRPVRTRINVQLK